MAVRGDERRGSLRKASGSRQTDFDPEMSEWGNPAIIRWLSYAEYIGVRGEPGELKHLSTLRKRNQPRFPLVVASERGLALKWLLRLAERSGKCGHSG